MNIPLDRLYHYIRDIAQEIYGDRVIIYRFWPNGSKNINDLNHLNEGKHESLGPDDWYKRMVSPLIWCNDQEPLDHSFYKTNQTEPSFFVNLMTSVGAYSPGKNLNYQKNIFEKNILLHSEQRSPELKKYELDNELIPVYYWNHALLARDWFRYAENETFQKSTKKTFLIYNRAWSGTREYRLKFAELLIRLGLESHCQTSVNPIEPELDIHYELHKFKNTTWRPNVPLEKFFPTNDTPSHYSADFDTVDYNSTDIEVVLETLFDDQRLHLTEKSLRPIACGQPFILAGTHGSLKYLRGYGFKTFGHIWDEHYDEIENAEERLISITNLMQQITTWTPKVREQKMAQAQNIADYNRQRFFSKDFFDQIITELKTNLQLGFEEQARGNNYHAWITLWTSVMSHTEVKNFLTTPQHYKLPNMDSVNQVLLTAQSKLKGKK
jgi:hypothetical protein